MTANTRQTRPLLVVVTGRPGSGKTTLAHRLARAIRCPALCRDEFKEGRVNTTGETGDDVQRSVYEAFFDAVELLVRRRITLVAEAAFQHARWAHRLKPMLATARVRIVLCEIDPKLARSRHVERGLADPDRERFHDDRPVRAARDGIELPLGAYDAPRLDVPLLTVDTADGYTPDLDAIVSFVRG